MALHVEFPEMSEEMYTSLLSTQPFESITYDVILQNYRGPLHWLLLVANAMIRSLVGARPVCNLLHTNPFPGICVLRTRKQSYPRFPLFVESKSLSNSHEADTVRHQKPFRAVL